ncbi:hypothetical protein D9M73_174750 [compost metagenome]
MHKRLQLSGRPRRPFRGNIDSNILALWNVQITVTVFWQALNALAAVDHAPGQFVFAIAANQHIAWRAASGFAGVELRDQEVGIDGDTVRHNGNQCTAGVAGGRSRHDHTFVGTANRCSRRGGINTIDYCACVC